MPLMNTMDIHSSHSNSLLLQPATHRQQPAPQQQQAMDATAAAASLAAQSAPFPDSTVSSAANLNILQVPTPQVTPPKPEKSLEMYTNGSAPGQDYTYTQSSQQLASPASNSSIPLPSSYSSTNSGSTYISQSSYEEFQKTQELSISHLPNTANGTAAVHKQENMPMTGYQRTSGYTPLENINPALSSQGFHTSSNGIYQQPQQHHRHHHQQQQQHHHPYHRQSQQAQAQAPAPQQNPNAVYSLPQGTATSNSSTPTTEQMMANGQSANLFATNDLSLMTMQSPLGAVKPEAQAMYQTPSKANGHVNGRATQAAQQQQQQPQQQDQQNGSSDSYSQASTTPTSQLSAHGMSSARSTPTSHYSHPAASYPDPLQGFHGGYPMQNMIQQYPPKHGGMTIHGHHHHSLSGGAGQQDVAQLNQQAHPSLGLSAMGNGHGWVNANYYMGEHQILQTPNGATMHGAINLSLPDSHGQLTAHQYMPAYNGGHALGHEYPVGAGLQIISANSHGGVAVATSNAMYGHAGATAGAAVSHIMPIQMGSWQTESRIPVKSLMVQEGINLHEFLSEYLSCPDKVHELTPMSISNNNLKRSKSKAAEDTTSSRNNGKNSKLKEKYLSNNLNRLFMPAGIGGQTEVCRQRQAENNPVTVTREEMIDELINAIEFASCMPDEMEQHRCGKGDVGTNLAQQEVGRGIPMQLSLPEGVPVVMDANLKDEIDSSFISWKPLRTKPEHFFRMEERHGRTFSLEEVKEVIDIILSRPPRRINRYCARQLLTDVSYGQGRGVTEFNAGGQERSPHMMSYMTRQEYPTVPIGATTKDGTVELPDQAKDASSHVESSLMPYQNTKKSCIYDPIWCRKTGSQKEGWCNHCKDGGWYLMKNSGFLYHKNHEHGIFPQGFVFEDPLVIRRKLIREARWEGQCGICYHWVDLDHTERKTWGTWYRHYKLCAAEYEEMKKLVKATGLPLDLVEVEYIPNV